ncbi:hypothetical protein GCM10010232_49540 [Streptomyces amakusaensis]
MTPRTTPPTATADTVILVPHAPAPGSTGFSTPTAAGGRQAAEQWALVTAGVVIIALTGGAFWLSYAHLAEVAGQHGLGHSPARQWAWPASLDGAIVAGELLMLRAGLRREIDWWAIALTAGGSVGSIALNIAGVSSTGRGGSVPVLDYVVAAVPPTAALVAFGVLMRQIHQLVAPAAAAVVTLAGETGTQDALDQRTKTLEGPDHSTRTDALSGGTDQTGNAADHLRTTADQPPTGANHESAAGPPRTNPADHRLADQDRMVADQPVAGPGHARTTAGDQAEAADQAVGDHSSGTPRTSVTAGQAAEQAADHQRTAQPSPPDPSVGIDADQPVSTAPRDRSAADQRPVRTDGRPADQPLADQDQTDPDHRRTAGPDQTEGAREHPRTTEADQNEDEPVPMERLVKLARTAALTEGRMTRRVIRPYLRAQSIQISNEKFGELQARLYEDPALAHLPRSQRKTR